MATQSAEFRPGNNIAMKVPPHEFPRAVAFYRDVVRLKHLGHFEGSEVFEFGGLRLWIDPMPQLSQAEIWLELETEDTAAAAEQLAAGEVARCDEIEPLPPGFDGFWIANPAGIVHLISKAKADRTGD